MIRTAGAHPLRVEAAFGVEAALVGLALLISAATPLKLVAFGDETVLAELFGTWG